MESLTALDLLSARKGDFYVDEHRDYLPILLAGVELPFSDRRNSRLIQVRVLRRGDSYVADGTILPNDRFEADDALYPRIMGFPGIKRRRRFPAGLESPDWNRGHRP